MASMSNEAMILKNDAGGRMLLLVKRQVELVREVELGGLSGPGLAMMAGRSIRPSPPGVGNMARCHGQVGVLRTQIQHPTINLPHRMQPTPPTSRLNNNGTCPTSRGALHRWPAVIPI
jgi:hypothetical protein